MSSTEFGFYTLLSGAGGILFAYLLTSWDEGMKITASQYRLVRACVIAMIFITLLWSPTIASFKVDERTIYYIGLLAYMLSVTGFLLGKLVEYKREQKKIAEYWDRVRQITHSGPVVYRYNKVPKNAIFKDGDFLIDGDDRLYVYVNGSAKEMMDMRS